MLTKDEALLAAEVAEKYPPGYGHRYGYSLRLDTGVIDDGLGEEIRTCPRVGVYG